MARPWHRGCSAACVQDACGAWTSPRTPAAVTLRPIRFPEIQAFQHPDLKGSTQDLYLCQRTGPAGPWGPPANLQTVNSHTHDQSPCLTSDGLTLYFGSLRRGGFGGHDFWKASHKSPDAPFTDITNLGSTINTFIQHRDPHLAADDRTLLFVRMFRESPLLGSVLHAAVPDGSGAWHVMPVHLPVKGMVTDPFAHTAPVGSFPANPSGLYDRSGNLWEWCGDWFDEPRKLRVLRGHSFLCNNGAGAKLSARGSAPPDQRQPIFGLRVVLASTPE